MVKKRKVLKFGVWRKMTKLKEIDKNTTAAQIYVRFWPRAKNAIGVVILK